MITESGEQGIDLIVRTQGCGMTLSACCAPDAEDLFKLSMAETVKFIATDANGFCILKICLTFTDRTADINRQDMGIKKKQWL